MARVDLTHGINAQLVHRWRRRAAECGQGKLDKLEHAQSLIMATTATPIAWTPEAIHIELCRGACAVRFARPTSAARS